MSKKKKQHYVPIFYLSYFVATSKKTPFLWVFEKDKAVPFKKSPKNIAFKNYFYCYEIEDEIQFEIEDRLSEIEGEVSTIFRELKNGKIDFENNNKRYLFGKFISFMNYRTERSRNNSRILNQNMPR